MKKILSLFAASAMILAMVGCEISIEPQDFSEHSETITKANSAYPIDAVKVTDGTDYLDAYLNADGNPVLKTKKKGNAEVTFYSKASRKKATKSITILGSGDISTSFTPLKYTTYNSTSTGTSHNESWWVDDPSDDIGCGKSGMYFYDYTNYETDGEDNPIPEKEAYIYVKGDIIYYLKYKNDTESPDGSTNYYYNWVRGVVTKSGDDVSIAWGSKGELNDRVTKNVSSTTEKLLATQEELSTSVSNVPTVLRSSVRFTYSSIQKEVTFGINDLVFKLQDDDSPYSFPTDKEWLTLQ